MMNKTVELRSKNISMIDCLKESAQRFHFDQIHLVTDTGKKFVANIIHGIRVMIERLEHGHDSVSDEEDAAAEAGFIGAKWPEFVLPDDGSECLPDHVTAVKRELTPEAHGEEVSDGDGDKEKTDERDISI